MNRGFIKLFRKIEDNPLWLNDNEPFCKRSAWVDLILLANHKDNSFVMGLQKMHIKRGQKWTSSKKLAERWGWSPKRVLNYLRFLETEGMIYLEVTNRGLLITLVNYSVYQDISRGQGNATDHANVTSEEKQGSVPTKTNKNVKNDIKNDIKNEKKKAPFSDLGKGGIVYEE